jgi:hypothetical protein
MTEPEQKIIVFAAYDTVMSANLVKTKLDAYGIPCFLTDEHFVGLYPIRNDLFPGVRLHIFEKDKEQVKEILVEETKIERICPACGSTNIIYEPSKQGNLTSILTSIMLGLFLPVKKVYRCENCEREFESLESN